MVHLAVADTVYSDQFVASFSLAIKVRLRIRYTFMSADSFHHQVELLLKNRKNYDFEDFGSAVSTANSGKEEVLKMQVGDFYEWLDCSSQPKLQKTKDRVYLKDIVEIKASRGA
ncbi:hypothetical protein J6590_036307 [Homalodisca vitripennis]|nr:hypothetical protein J6590_036307 [Homalodisca vitripennis]